MDVKERTLDRSKKPWATPHLVLHGSVEKVTGWLGFGAYDELFGGKWGTPIDWGDGTGS